ncbi:MAG: DUF6036 family nucleotidyltransferase [Bdellovibrionaceae bacterium]|nr:DUF6036 family nucleotidyltransferase [Pseudobdellovibrionaceae bacterium]
MGPLTGEIMKSALRRLDELLPVSVTLIMGGGGAMILAHGFPLGTTDIDAIPKGMDISELDPLVKQIAREQDLPGDWLNPYFSTFAHTLPADFSTRLIEVFSGKRLTVQALGREEMLIMKCFAHRQKDVGHAKTLIKAGADLELVEDQISLLRKKGIPHAEAALDFLDDVLAQLDEAKPS